MKLFNLARPLVRIFALPREPRALAQKLDTFQRQLNEVNQSLAELKHAMRRHSMPPRHEWDRRALSPTDGGLPLSSSLCRQSDFDRRWLRDWLARYGEPIRYHRGLWEWAYVGQ